ncbi:LysR family transcriptional regulator [Pseudolabrys taiwanensis]|uniref:LysR family transcriptional regulator n=1 Tax=Pseudolabrys taiwanensis TaxID=331696 RepID=A0A345ZUF1_9HYPH|nr:LysR family transcriptional regulator [Pseudolabrys taiwanensis]AXK80548.1 LysR family transcriptional regulator [Pseudolabrys taiwanensis]
MDIYLNFKAFQAVAQTGSFSRAARDLGLAASVVTKRVNQLESVLGATLFRRSTRSLVLTEAGARYLDRSRLPIAEFDALIKGSSQAPGEVEDSLRIKAPTSLTELRLRPVFAAFQAEFQKIRLEIVLLDRMVDPIIEGFDVSIGAHWPQSFVGVVERPLCPLPRVLCAAPAYLARRGVPKTPQDLIQHDCLSFIPTGNDWTFMGPHGAITIAVRPRLTSNDGQMLVAAALSGAGIAIVSRYMTNDLIRSGELMPVLVDFPIPDLWVKAVSPERRAATPAVTALIEWLAVSLAAHPP